MVLSQIRSKHFQRLRLTHFVCPDCVYESTNQASLIIHLQEKHHDNIICPNFQCGQKFDKISQCFSHLNSRHRREGNFKQYQFMLIKCCNNPHSRLFNYNGYKYNPTEEFYFEFHSEDYLRNFFGYR